MENAEEESKTGTDDPSRMMWAMGAYSLIIVTVLLISRFASWLSGDTARLLIALTASLAVRHYFQPYLAEHRKVRMWILGGLVALLLLGMVVFFLVR